MKTLSGILSATAAFLALSLSSHGQTVVTYVGTTGLVNQQPGDADEFIDFWTGDYDFSGPSNNHSAYNSTVSSNLDAFTINGNLNTEDTFGNGFSVITTPDGQTFTTGALEGDSPGIAFALTPGVTSNGGASYTLDPTFNYNDFNVYLMYSNVNDTQTDAVISLDTRGSSGASPYFGYDDVAVTDNTNAGSTNPSTADYIEFNVTGLGAALAANPGADLVVDVNLPAGDGYPAGSYIGGVSFVSAPEPSTYAMLLVGALGLLVLTTRSRVQQRS